MIDIVIFIATLILMIYYENNRSKKNRSADHTFDVLEDKEEEVNNNTIDITIEYAENYYFVYDRKTLAYMAHGKTKKDLEKLLVLKYPNKQFNCTSEELRLINEK